MSKYGTVLIVEDQPDERRLLFRTLQDYFSTVSTSSAEDAMRYVNDNIDVVLTDLHMGDVSGIDLMGLWKRKKQNTQFIIITGDRQPEQGINAMKLGIFDYLMKPINPDLLIETVAKAMSLVSL